MSATIIHADGHEESVIPQKGGKFSLKDLQEIVHGYIEIHNTIDGDVLVCNEEGRLLGLPYNCKASRLYDIDSIVGDVLVCDPDMIG